MRARLVLAGAALLACQMSRPASAQSPADDSERAQQGLRLVQQGRLQEALPLLRDVVVRTTDRPAIWLAYATALEATAAWREANVALQRALAIGVFGEPVVAVRIARNFVSAGAADSALWWLEHAVRNRLEARLRIQTDTVLQRLSGDPRFAELAGLAPAGQYSREERWRYDIDFLVREAQRMHVGADRPAFSERFLRAADSLKGQVPTISDDRIAARLVRLLAMLGDGHTGMRPNLRTFPYLLYLFADGLFVANAAGPAEPLIGARVLRIGPLSAEEALRRVEPFVSRDNAMGLRWHAPRLLNVAAIVREIGASGSDTVELQVLRGERDTSVARVAIADGQGVPGRLTRLRSWTDSVPFFLRHERFYWYAPLPERRAVYFQFNAVDQHTDAPLSQFAEELKGTLRTTGARHLIVDLRQNPGGNTFLFPPLFSAILHFAESDTANRVWVLVGRTTFSAAQNFASTLDRFARNVTFAGEPSGSRPNFVGESAPVVLPFSKLQGSISTRYHQNADFNDHRSWIAPMLSVPMTARDYFARRDPVLEAILKIIGGRSTVGS